MSMNMNLGIGKPVYTRDGDRVGKIARLVVVPDRNELLEFIVHEGVLVRHDRIVDRAFIERTDDEGAVYLRISSDEEAKLPPLVEQEYAVGMMHDAGSYPAALGAGPTMNQPIQWRGATTGREMHPVSRMTYETLVQEASAVTVRSNLPDEAVTIGHDVEVMDADGRVLGTVARFTFDDDFRIREVLVHGGIFHRGEYRVPAENVAVITHRYLRLRTADEPVIAGPTTDVRES